MFTDRKKNAALLVAGIDGSGGDDKGSDDDSHGEDLEDLADDLLRAITSKSPGAIAEAFRAMFMSCESEPHDEGGEEDEDDQD